MNMFGCCWHVLFFITNHTISVLLNVHFFVVQFSFPLCFSFFIFNDPFDFIWLRKHEMHYTNIKFNGCYAFRKSTHRKEKEETHFVFHLNDIAFSGMGMECVLFLCVHNEMWKMENLLAFFSLSCCIGYWYCWHYAFKSVYYLRYSIGSCF